jgi:hypothetical protein
MAIIQYREPARQSHTRPIFSILSFLLACLPLLVLAGLFSIRVYAMRVGANPNYDNVSNLQYRHVNKLLRYCEISLQLAFYLPIPLMGFFVAIGVQTLWQAKRLLAIYVVLALLVVSVYVADIGQIATYVPD